MNSVRIRSYSGPYFPAFGLNTIDIRGIRSISPYSGLMRESADHNNPEHGRFLRSANRSVICKATRIPSLLY